MSLPQHFPHEREEEPEGTEASSPAPDAFSDSLHEAILNEAPVTTLEELLAAGAEVDAVDSLGETPLWLAVTLGARDAVEVLLRAGADPWAPTVAGRSPGEYALEGPLADLFRDLPGAPLPGEAERRTRRHADVLLSSYRWIDDLIVRPEDITVVGGVTEEHVIQRLGAEPDRCPTTMSPLSWFDDEPTLEDLENGHPETFDLYLGAQEGGVCLLGQKATTSRVCRLLSEGTRLAAAVFIEVKAICSLECWVDGVRNHRVDPMETPPEDLDAAWTYRFGDHAHPSSYEARALAFMTEFTGVEIDADWLRKGRMRGVNIPGA